jgi:hypothetical protein
MRPVTRTVSAQEISDPVRVNWRGGLSGFQLSALVALSSGATLTYTVEHTGDDPANFDDITDYNTNATWYNTTGLVALTANDEGNIAFPVQAVRLNVTAYTDGSATLTVLQAN